MKRPTFYHLIALVALVLSLAAVGAFLYLRRSPSKGPTPTAPSTPAPPAAPLVIAASDGFDYPVGKSAQVTAAKDRDGWYNAQDFGENDHLGEDWNANTGGNTDCGLPVYVASKGTIVFAADAGPGWGKVIIVRHRLPDGALVETLYGHLQSLNRTEGDVARRERIGSIGDADGAYPCHLHVELRFPNCPAWGAAGPGYSSDRTGWADPSDYIDAHRSYKNEARRR